METCDFGLRDGPEIALTDLAKRARARLRHFHMHRLCLFLLTNKISQTYSTSSCDVIWFCVASLVLYRTKKQR